MNLADKITTDEISEEMFTNWDNIIPTLIENESYIAIQDVDVAIADKYKGDFYGLLLFLNIHTKFHYVTLRLNDLKSSDAYDGNTTNIKVFSAEYITNIYNTYIKK